MSDKKRKKLNPLGCPNYYLIFDDIDKSVISFKYIERKPDNAEQINFSELNVLNFVANSYKYACLCFIGNISESKKNRKHLIDLYLPLHFCFRHYLELKLKLIYSDYANEEFLKGHDLKTLKYELRQNCNYDADVFDAPIDYIESVEQGSVEHFRYLVTKDFIFTEKLVIPLNMGEKIFGFISRIETLTGINRLNRLSKN